MESYAILATAILGMSLSQAYAAYDPAKPTAVAPVAPSPQAVAIFGAGTLAAMMGTIPGGPLVPPYLYDPLNPNGPSGTPPSGGGSGIPPTQGY